MGNDEQREIRRLAKHLRRLAAEYRESEETNVIPMPGVIPIEPTPFEFRDPSAIPPQDANPLRKALRDFARELGSNERMVEVYDMLVEMDGYPAVQRVNSAWSGIHGWCP